MGLLGSGSVHMSGRSAAKLGSNTQGSSQNARCQRCLQIGHWTYECKNEVAYQSRPSRTQQLKNPKVRQRFMDPSELPEDPKAKGAKGAANGEGRKKGGTKKKKKKQEQGSDSDDSGSDSGTSSDSSSSSSSSGSDSSSSSDGSSSSSSGSDSSSSDGSSSSGSSSSDGSGSSSSDDDSSSSSSDDDEPPAKKKRPSKVPSIPVSNGQAAHDVVGEPVSRHQRDGVPPAGPSERSGRPASLDEQQHGRGGPRTGADDAREARQRPEVHRGPAVDVHSDRLHGGGDVERARPGEARSERDSRQDRGRELEGPTRDSNLEAGASRGGQRLQWQAGRTDGDRDGERDGDIRGKRGERGGSLIEGRTGDRPHRGGDDDGGGDGGQRSRHSTRQRVEEGEAARAAGRESRGGNALPLDDRWAPDESRRAGRRRDNEGDERRRGGQEPASAGDGAGTEEGAGTRRRHRDEADHGTAADADGRGGRRRHREAEVAALVAQDGGVEEEDDRWRPSSD